MTETRKKYDEMVSSGKATEAQLERQAKKVNDAQAEYNKLQTELGQVEADLRSLSSTLGKQEEAWTKLSKKVDAAADKMQVSGEKMRSIGRNMTTYMTTPLVAMGVAAAKTGMDFEAQMSRVGAISQATGKELGQLNKQALELGASTSKSASEVALGMENLAAMGFEVNEIIGAMPGVIAAAEASGEDMALTADVMAAAINAFGLEASDASHVADVLAQAANQSAADINDMGYAFKYAAPVAKMLGISLEELAAATGIMTDSGLAGEQAGTALRSALLRLSDPPKAAANELKRLGINITDASGNMLPFSNIIGQLGKKTDGMANAQKAAALSTIFGTEAVSGMLAVIEAGPEKLDKLTKGLRKLWRCVRRNRKENEGQFKRCVRRTRWNH